MLRSIAGKDIIDVQDRGLMWGEEKLNYWKSSLDSIEYYNDI